jgi:ribonuclease R
VYTHDLSPAGPLAARVVRWGKFWALEPLFVDERHYLVAKGGKRPRLNDLVLAVQAKHNRMRIVEVLGDAGDLRAVLRALLYAERIAQGFPSAVLEEAAAIVGRQAAADDGRVDLRGLPTFTIDPETAKDFDDAISVAREGDTFRVHVHIADVSFYVDADGAIEAEARRRTASVYLPLFAVPMLPDELSSGVCSLKPREDRKCVTVEFLFSAKGDRLDVNFYRSLIRSDYRLTYGCVDEVLEGRAVERVGSAAEMPAARGEGAPPVEVDPALAGHLRSAHDLARTLRDRRFARGALQIGSFEPEYHFNERGEIESAIQRVESESHSLVEEFMLAANEAVAGFLVEHRGGAIYRVHEPPEARSAEGLLDKMEDLDIPTPAFPGDESATAGQIAGAFRRLSETLPRLSARENRGRLAFPQLLLRALKQAYYGPDNLGHFGLAVPAYLHFTSPIRRYPDLVVHRRLLAKLGVGGHELGEAELYDIAAACSAQERKIAKIELTADDIALAFLLEKTLYERGWEAAFDGEIVGLIPAGVFVHFGGAFEGFLPARHLPGDYFDENVLGTALVGRRTHHRYRLGDPVRVQVVRVDRVTGKVELAPAGAEEAGGSPHPRPVARDGASLTVQAPRG